LRQKLLAMVVVRLSNLNHDLSYPYSILVVYRTDQRLRSAC